MDAQGQDIVIHTMAFWSERVGEEVSQEDARQMIVNVSGFFHVLAAWERRAKNRDDEGVARTEVSPKCPPPSSPPAVLTDPTLQKGTSHV
jgi:hypothetical protein